MSSWGMRAFLKNEVLSIKNINPPPQFLCKIKSSKPLDKKKRQSEAWGDLREVAPMSVESTEHAGHASDTPKEGMTTFKPTTLWCLNTYYAAAPGLHIQTAHYGMERFS